MKNKKKVYVITPIVAILLIVLIVYTAWGNTALKLTTYTIKNENIPTGFDGYRIAQISDLHNNELDKDNENLLAMIKLAQPEIIVITGDLIDSRKTDVDIATKFVQDAVEIAPCYFVTGNHESRVNEYYTLKENLNNFGVEILECEHIELEYNNDEISLLGIDDPSFNTDYDVCGYNTTIDNELETLIPDNDNYTILLSHRPEPFEIYAKYDIDLVLSGHAHGGQFSLPFIGGLFAPDQGLLPKYDAGLFREDDTDMIVSAGVGNSIFPFRFNNRPEVVLVELKAKS